MPVERQIGDEIVGASVNAGGRLIIRATKVGNDTALAQIARLVEQAQNGKAPVQRLADRISAIFVPVILVLAAASLAFWLADGASTGRGAQLGLLIKGPEVLESTRRVARSCSTKPER